ncbi:hypothetical protein LR48_Vigan03g077100 [Vigna angularis]|uniref:Uncharacterized protein n=1 Tax=Phaseolus angularis TaxID=3914 RepID=A0A0L9U4R4_PHAAN|nr:hypothetical protein LR48_Vigan03g077100 [Vigna angularis]
MSLIVNRSAKSQTINSDLGGMLLWVSTKLGPRQSYVTMGLDKADAVGLDKAPARPRQAFHAVDLDKASARPRQAFRSASTKLPLGLDKPSTRSTSTKLPLDLDKPSARPRQSSRGQPRQTFHSASTKPSARPRQVFRSASTKFTRSTSTNLPLGLDKAFRSASTSQSRQVHPITPDTGSRKRSRRRRREEHASTAGRGVFRDCSGRCPLFQFGRNTKESPMSQNVSELLGSEQEEKGNEVSHYGMSWKETPPTVTFGRPRRCAAALVWSHGALVNEEEAPKPLLRFYAVGKENPKRFLIWDRKWAFGTNIHQHYLTNSLLHPYPRGLGPHIPWFFFYLAFLF